VIVAWPKNTRRGAVKPPEGRAAPADLGKGVLNFKFYSDEASPAGLCRLRLTSSRFVRAIGETPETSAVHRGEGSNPMTLVEREDPNAPSTAAWRAESPSAQERCDEPDRN